jgi:hypothetical protein
MTIKQQGGIFGRNPTFNDVTIEGELTFDGDIDVNSDLKVSGDLEVLGGITINSSPFPEIILKDADLSNVYGRVYSASGNTHIESDVTNQQAGSSLLFTVDGDTKAQISSGGNLTVNNGNLIMGTSGKGIDFSATSGTGTSELFDDYEEGTWTPVIIGGTIAGSGTYSQQDGVYTKVGNLVTVSCYLAFTAHTGTGHMKISGLPFPGVGSSVDFQAGATQAQHINAGTSATQLSASIVTTASDISLYGFVNNAAKVATQVNASGSGSQLAITLTYRTS